MKGFIFVSTINLSDAASFVLMSKNSKFKIKGYKKSIHAEIIYESNIEEEIQEKKLEKES